MQTFRNHARNAFDQTRRVMKTPLDINIRWDDTPVPEGFGSGAMEDGGSSKWPRSLN
jgi:hypothetical protein